jgi:hypothetical protein
MSMSDCEKCWDSLCTCGWQYRKWNKKRLIEMRDMFQQLIDGTHVHSEENDITEHEQKVITNGY